MSEVATFEVADEVDRPGVEQVVGRAIEFASFVGSSPMFTSPTRGAPSPNTISARSEPITPNWARNSGRQSGIRARVDQDGRRAGSLE